MGKALKFARVDREAVNTAGLTPFDKVLKLPGFKKRIDNFFNLSPKIGQGAGLELSPLFQPLVNKDKYNVDYCDYLSHDELIKREQTHPTKLEYDLEIQKLDFVWEPGKRLIDSVPKVAGKPKKYDYIASSHVLEHVPDFLGYLENMDEVLNEGGVIAFYLPNPLGSPEIFRPQSSIGDVLEAYVKAASQPSFSNIYDYYRMSIDASVPYKKGTLGNYARSHSAETAVRDGLGGYINYIDAHCWVFSPESLKELIDELRVLGILNYTLTGISESAPTKFGRGFEYSVVLEKNTAQSEVSEAATNLRNARKVALQGETGNNSSSLKMGYEAALQAREKDLTHGTKAFYEAVVAQEQLKLENAVLKEFYTKVLREKELAINHGFKAFYEAVEVQEMLKSENLKLRDSQAEILAEKDQAIEHGVKAFYEAVALQELLKNELAQQRRLYEAELEAKPKN